MCVLCASARGVSSFVHATFVIPGTAGVGLRLGQEIINRVRNLTGPCLVMLMVATRTCVRSGVYSCSAVLATVLAASRTLCVCEALAELRAAGPTWCVAHPNCFSQCFDRLYTFTLHERTQARLLGAKSLFVESNTVLGPALALYEKLGFTTVEGFASPYKRCNFQAVMYFA